MRIICSVEIATIQDHLKDLGSGVKLDPGSMPGPPDAHRGFKVLLDADDVQNLVLYWEFQNVTRDKSCRVTDLLDSAASLERVKSFIEGDAAKGFISMDLRTAPKTEPVIVTNDLEGPFLYHIDGNHRVIAQYLSKKGFQDVAGLGLRSSKLAGLELRTCVLQAALRQPVPKLSGAHGPGRVRSGISLSHRMNEPFLKVAVGLPASGLPK